FFEEALRAVESLPGVVSAGLTNSLPLTGINDQGSVVVEGMPTPAPGEDGPQANRPHVSGGYFATLGIRLLDRRGFDARDRPGAPPVGVVSALAARTFWPGESPLGKHVAADWTAAGPVWRRVVGVVESTRHFGLEAPQKAEVYLPAAQSPSPFMTLVVRTALEPPALVPDLRAAIAPADPQQPVFPFRTREELSEGPRARGPGGVSRWPWSPRSPRWPSSSPRSACTA